MKEKNIITWLVVLVIIIVGGLIGLSKYAQYMKVVITDFSIDKPHKYLIATGSNITKMEVWVIPTGTNISPDDYTLLGTMNMLSTPGTDHEQTFGMPIPDQPFSATEIFVRAYDKRNRLVATKSLQYIGATEIHTALWGS